MRYKLAQMFLSKKEDCMPKTRFIIHVYEDVEPIDVGATYGVLSMAKRLDPGIEIAIVARKAGPVRLANGLEIIVPYGISNCPPGDVLMILGGAAWPEQSRDERTLTFIRSFGAGGIVASVCTGALIVAATGLLDGKTATTRRYSPRDVETPLSLMEKLYPQVRGSEARFVDNGAVVTGGGVVLAVDTTLHLIARLRGNEIARETARIIEYAWTDAQGRFEPQAHSHKVA
jgi:transcriptional regulator GlxA family with amidase domain